jgi:hypothetical protein
LESKDKIPSKSDEGSFGRECRVCVESNARSPQFNSFIFLLGHLLEHQATRDKEPITISFDPRTGNLLNSLPVEEGQGFPAKVSPNQKAVLPLISWWLQQALTDLDFLSAAGVPISERLVELISQLPEKYSDQQQYMLRYANYLKAAAVDRDWPRTADFQAKFIADSLAGAHCGLQPSTSREYVRQVRKQKLPVPDLVRWALQEWFREAENDSVG